MIEVPPVPSTVRGNMASPSGTTAVYDSIGTGYSRVRRSDPRIAAQIQTALGTSEKVLNVGAGAGSYEPTDRLVIAVEPSLEMIRQRRRPASRHVIQAVAGDLPFRTGEFDGVLALLTVHHWPDIEAGLRELRRVNTGPVVVFTFDHAVHASQWLVTDYLPMMVELDADLPSPEAIARMLGGGRVDVVPVPHDCSDGFCHAYWRRPEAYLEPTVRAAISGIARLPAVDVAEGIRRLSGDLESGAWASRHQDLLELDEIDTGYRLVIAHAVTDSSTFPPKA